MTVQELIDKLLQIEDKTKPVIIIQWFEDDHEELTVTDVWDRSDHIVLDNGYR